MPSISLSLISALVLPIFVSATSYDVAKVYAGSTFFDDWNFYGNYDNLTNGDVTFLSASENSKDNLAYVNSAGNAIIKVDNTTNVAYNYKRNSIRISSKDEFAMGSVWVADMLHVPYGCSVWPAFWSQAPNWPSGGEIDTFEGVNQVTMNQMTLHTESGCTQVSPVQTSNIINSTDCSVYDNDNQGCVVTDPSTQSYGEGFANAGGGVYITEFASSGISIWFFNRSSVPSSLSSNASSIDTSNFGTPVANWPTGGCEISKYFQAQNLIFDITLCGDYAGTQSVFNQTCTGVCYEDYVIGDGSDYDNAYFEVQYVRVYGTNNIISTSAASPLKGAAITSIILALSSVLAGLTLF